ncbi:MAG: hypothetical protein ABW252_03620 [Polyangiales bacterium]
MRRPQHRLILVALLCGAALLLSRSGDLLAKAASERVGAASATPLAPAPEPLELARTHAAQQAAPTATRAPLLPRETPVEHLDELVRSRAEDRVLWMAEERAVADCMRARGFSYLPSPPDERSDEAVAFTRIEPGDVDAARAVGYGLAEALTHGAIPKDDFDANAAQLDKLAPERREAFLEALSGPAVPANAPNARGAIETVALPGGGSASWYRDSCFAQARRALYGDDYAHNELGYAEAILREQIREEVEREPAHVAAIARWSACMREGGFAYARPDEPSIALSAAHHAGKLSLEALRDEEQRIATADARCVNETGLHARRREAESRSEASLVRARRDDLLAMRTAREQASTRARELLREGDDEE